MIKHCVMLNLKTGYDHAALMATFEGLRALTMTLPGCSGFDGGPNHDFEQKSAGYPYGFIIGFVDRPARQSYADNADHKKLGGDLVAQCNGGADGILVFDIVTDGGVGQ